MSKELDFLKKIVIDASKLITDDFKVDAKGNNGDLVTTYDYMVEQYLISQMNEAYPDFTIISEEYNSNNGLTENCFTIDPIDGTINFAHGLPMWVIQVAMVKKGKVCASVIYAPKLNELYSADSSGAYLNDKPIHVTDLEFEDSIFSMEGKNRYPVITEVLKYTHHARIPGSAGLDYAFMSAGRTGAVLFRNNSIWDYTPGLYMVQQAGGYVIDEPSLHIAASTKKVADIIRKCCEIADTTHIKNSDI